MTEFLVTSSALIIAVTILHFLFRGKISCRLQYALWLPVLFRLLMPFPLPGSPFSVMNAVPAGTSAPVQSVVTGNAAVSGASVSAAGMSVPPVSAGAAASPMGRMGTAEIFRIVWLVGSIAVALWFLGTNLLFAARLRRTRKAFDAADFSLPVYVSRSAVSPCLFGFLHPAVYLTPKAAELGDNLRYVLAHELCHYRHGDNIWSVLRGVCLVAYWWNPLVWGTAILSRDDGELACDEAVIRQIGAENCLAYGRTLVDMVAVKKAPSGMMCSATTMASGKRGIKARLNMIIRNPKTLIPALVVVLAAAVVCVAATFTGAMRGNEKVVASSIPARSAGMSSSQLKVASGSAKELFSNRVQYIGDASADSALLRAIGMPAKLGSCTLELKTQNEPYILRIVGTGKVADPAALDKEMSRDAALLLALIDNASEIQWQYNSASGGTIMVGSLDEDRANDLLGGDIKAFGKSTGQVQALLNRLSAGIPQLDANRAVGSPTSSNSSQSSAASLETAVSQAILNHNAAQFLQGKFATESHAVLKTVERGNTITVYAMALYLEFGYPDGVPTDVSGSHMPVAITFVKSSDGKYSLKEYWEPKDGDYTSSIQSKFPADICQSALDTQKYILSQMQACYAKAIENNDFVDPDAALSKLLKTVCSSPTNQSNPKACIDAHPVEYQRMTYFGDYMLRWSFARFSNGGQTGLEGSIMASACREIIGSAEAGSPEATGQAWYDTFKKDVETQRRNNGDDYMKKNRPSSWHVLQLLGEAPD